jgi:probable phosphoglycerate mutase
MRARQTAALAGFPDARVVEDLREWDYGDYEGLTTAEIRLSVPGWTVWSHPCPGGESLTSVAERADAVLALAADAVGDVLAFGHGHALRGLASRWCGVDPAFGRLLALDPASVSELAHEREAPVVLTWNLHGFEA